MAHQMLTSPLPAITSLAQGQAIVAELTEADAMPPFAPKFFDLLGQATIAIFAGGDVREAEVIAPNGYPIVVVA